MSHPNTDRDERVRQGDFPVSSAPNDYGRKEDKAMSKNYDDFRAGMLRAAEMARNEFKRAPEAARGHDCVYMGGYEDACDHLSAVITQAAIIDCVRIAGAQPDWQYHISLLLPDDGVEDAALLKVYQVVEHELRDAATRMRDRLVQKVRDRGFSHNPNCRSETVGGACSCGAPARFDRFIKELQSLTLDVEQEKQP